jgi:hypothetical protein
MTIPTTSKPGVEKEDDATLKENAGSNAGYNAKRTCDYDAAAKRTCRRKV